MGKKSKRRSPKSKQKKQASSGSSSSSSSRPTSSASANDMEELDTSYLGPELVSFLRNDGQLTRDQLAVIDIDKCTHDEMVALAYSMRSWPVVMGQDSSQDLSTNSYGPGSPRSVQTFFGQMPEEALAKETTKENVHNSEREKGVDDERSATVAAIIREARELCPEAEEYYPVTRELFDAELWDEIQRYWLAPDASLDKEVVWKLLQQVRLDSVKTLQDYDQFQPDVRHLLDTDDRIEKHQELELLWSWGSTPGFSPVHAYWCCRWFDIVPGCFSTVFGNLNCAPFFNDVNFHDEEGNLRMHRGWQLIGCDGRERALEDIRGEVGLTAEDIATEDVARCLIPTIGVLAKYHPGNRNEVLKRLMLRLERQVRTWNEDDTSDPTEWEMSEVLHRRGGIISHPNVIEKLKREMRWDSA